MRVGASSKVFNLPLVPLMAAASEAPPTRQRLSAGIDIVSVLWRRVLFWQGLLCLPRTLPLSSSCIHFFFLLHLFSSLFFVSSLPLTPTSYVLLKPTKLYSVRAVITFNITTLRISLSSTAFSPSFSRGKHTITCCVQSL